MFCFVWVGLLVGVCVLPFFVLLRFSAFCVGAWNSGGQSYLSELDIDLLLHDSQNCANIWDIALVFGLEIGLFRVDLLDMAVVACVFEPH